MIVGLVMGFNNLLTFTDKSCFHSMVSFATSLYAVHQTFDSEFPTTFMGIVVAIAKYLSVA